jgi:hypothetical protein
MVASKGSTDEIFSLLFPAMLVPLNLRSDNCIISPFRLYFAKCKRNNYLLKCNMRGNQFYIGTLTRDFATWIAVSGESQQVKTLDFILYLI